MVTDLPPRRPRRGGRNLTTGGPDGTSPVVQARLPRQTHTALCAAADRLGLTVSEALRDAVEGWLAARGQAPAQHRD